MNNLKQGKNPIIWADFPDKDIIRVDDTYYMISTTMHVMPGAVILQSYDLINWEVSSYVYDTLDGTEGQRLEDGKGIYGSGMWAASFRYHKGTFYVVFVANDTHKTYLYQTEDIHGPWRKSIIEGFYHDCSLLFDDDDRVYLVYGNRTIYLVELRADLSGLLEGGLQRVLLVDTDDYGLGFEGCHLYKIKGKYYLFMIHWLKVRSGRRVEACYMADSLEGEFVGGDVLDDDLGYHNCGVAQGGIVDTPDGEWYAMLFQDHGAVGRIPVLVPVYWENDFPVFGIDGKVPQSLTVASTRPDHIYEPLVSSDDFSYDMDEFGKVKMKSCWQWNHEPDPKGYSFTERPGYYRIKTNELRNNIVQAKNTLTQRTMGPRSEAIVDVDGTLLNDGDYAGISAFQSNYAFIGITKEKDQSYIVMTSRSERKYDSNGRPIRYDTEAGIEHARVPIPMAQASLKVVCDFEDGIDEARCYYKLQDQWVDCGIMIKMQYTLDHFMGYRFALSCFSTKETGGIADFSNFIYHVME